MAQAKSSDVFRVNATSLCPRHVISRSTPCLLLGTAKIVFFLLQGRETKLSRSMYVCSFYLSFPTISSTRGKWIASFLSASPECRPVVASTTHSRSSWLHFVLRLASVARSGALVSAGSFCQGFTFSNEGYLYFRSDCKCWPDPMGNGSGQHGHAIKIRDDDLGGGGGWPARLDFTADRISLYSPSASSLNFRKRIGATCLFYCVSPSLSCHAPSLPSLSCRVTRSCRRININKSLFFLFFLHSFSSFSEKPQRGSCWTTVVCHSWPVLRKLTWIRLALWAPRISLRQR